MLKKVTFIKLSLFILGKFDQEMQCIHMKLIIKYVLTNSPFLELNYQPGGRSMVNTDGSRSRIWPWCDGF